MGLRNGIGTKSTARRAFTLIELLVVVAIIGVLMGLVFSAAMSSRRKARLVRADGEVRELAKAWKTYWITYGSWPPGFTGNIKEMDGPTMNILQGSNPQKIRFMDAGASVESSGLRDPWGNYYRVRFDRTTTPGDDVYETSVYFPNRQRFKYERP